MGRTTSMFNTGSQLAWWSAWYPPSRPELSPSSVALSTGSLAGRASGKAGRDHPTAAQQGLQVTQAV